MFIFTFFLYSLKVFAHGYDKVFLFNTSNLQMDLFDP